MLTPQIEKIKKESTVIRQEVRERTIGYVTAALGMVAGLAWNEAIKEFIGVFFPMGSNSILAKFIYAAFITGVVVVLTIYLTKVLKGGDEEAAANDK
jgi:hypothetical protein